MPHIDSGLVGLVGQGVGLVRNMGAFSRVLKDDGTQLVDTHGEGIRGTWEKKGVCGSVGVVCGQASINIPVMVTALSVEFGNTSPATYAIKVRF